jgi:hypothetical protein
MQFGLGTAPPSREDAAQQLAKLVEAELAIEIKPRQLIALLEKHWATLSKLAHAIHRDNQRRRASHD